MFPVIVQKCWCSQGLQQLPGFAFARGAALYQVMVIYGIFEGYVAHISHVDVPREMMAGATLYLLQVGMPSSMKPMKMDFMTTQLQRSSLGPTSCRWRSWIIAPRKGVAEIKPGTYQPLLVALDYHTQEGRCIKRKKKAEDHGPVGAQRGPNHEDICH
ncbi:hypothetical protein ACROYT_G014389 [Oculina patagonica]